MKVVGGVAVLGLIGLLGIVTVDNSNTAAVPVPGADSGPVTSRRSAPPFLSGAIAPVAIAAAEGREAGAAYQAGDIAASVQHFREAVDADPQNPEALNNYGQVLVRTGRASEAIAYFDRALEVSNDKWAYHFNRARAYAELQQWPRAIAGYRDALTLFPDDYATQFNLAKALQANGDLAGAIEGFERTIRLAPGEAEFLLTYGGSLETARRPADAAAAYRRFLELAPDSPQADKIKGRISLLDGQAVTRSEAGSAPPKS